MIYDVSVCLDSSTPIFPGDAAFSRTLSASLTEEGKTCNTSMLSFGAHTGTHIDAPLHMMKEGKDISKIPPDQLAGPARVVEIDDPKQISLTELKRRSWQGVHKVLFKTRNSGLWKTSTFEKNYVYLENDAAELLVEKGVDLVGIDYLSIERFGADRFSAHLTLLRRGVVILEGLNLSAVPEGDYIFFCGPLLLSGADGSPCRVFLVDNDTLETWTGLTH